MEKLTKKEAALEGILFALGEAVEETRLSKVLEISVKEVQDLIQNLNTRYEEGGHGVEILELEGSFQMCTRKELYGDLIRICKTPKKQVLTEAVLETLSIIAYCQPVTRAQIEHIRGVNSQRAVSKLVEYGLVYEAGRLDAPGRPAQFATTEEFLRRFGIESRGALPKLDPKTEESLVHQVEEETGYKFPGHEEENGN